MPPIIRDPAKWMCRPDAAIILPRVRMSRLLSPVPRGTFALRRGSHRSRARGAIGVERSHVRPVAPARQRGCTLAGHASCTWYLLYRGLGASFGVALVFGVLNVAVRPVLLILTLPFLLITLGFFLLVLNAVMLLLTSAVSDALGLGFHRHVIVFFSGPRVTSSQSCVL